jgi:hypothetical protein
MSYSEQFNEMIQTLSEVEQTFLQENPQLTSSYYRQLTGIKTESVIYCDNSYERRIVHILAHAMGLHHARHGEWLEERKWDDTFDTQCKCRYCWKAQGEKYYRIVGVKVSKNALPLSRKDRANQRKMRNIFASASASTSTSTSVSPLSC